eukprot:3571696-Pyramimonas_sp.AAC.1
MEQSYKELKGRFDRRESRSEDVRRIRELGKEVKLAKEEQRRLAFEAEQLRLQLDNRDEMDRVFGGAAS